MSSHQHPSPVTNQQALWSLNPPFINHPLRCCGHPKVKRGGRRGSEVPQASGSHRGGSTPRWSGPGDPVGQGVGSSNCTLEETKALRGGGGLFCPNAFRKLVAEPEESPGPRSLGLELSILRPAPGTQRMPCEDLLAGDSCMSESRTARGGGGRTPLLRCCPLLGQGRAGPAAGRSGLQSGALLLLRTPASLGKMTPSMATQGASYLPSSAQLRLTPTPTRPPMCGLPGTPTTLSWSWERSEGLGARAHLPALQVGLCAGYSWGGGVCVLGVQPEAPPPPPARRWGSHMDCERAASTPAWGLTCLQAGSRVGDSPHGQDTTQGGASNFSSRL